MIDPLLLTCPRVYTYAGDRALTTASGFLFERAGQLFLITARHVVSDPQNGHEPDRIGLAIHTSETNVAETALVFVPLLADGGAALWRGAVDDAGGVDVAAIEIDAALLPETARYATFTPAHLVAPGEIVAIGTSLLTVGYPMAFEDALHKLPVARQGSLASSFGLRFGGQGYFLVDSRTHRGVSGAPVAISAGEGFAPQEPNAVRSWRLLGVHSARLDSPTRDPAQDEALGLNTVWYADVVMTLTD